MEVAPTRYVLFSFYSYKLTDPMFGNLTYDGMIYNLHNFGWCLLRNANIIYEDLSDDVKDNFNFKTFM